MGLGVLTFPGCCAGWGLSHPPIKDQISFLPAPGTYLGSQLLLLLGGKFRATVERDIHLSQYLANPPLHGHTLVGRPESFQHQESILPKLQAGSRLRLLSPCPQTLLMRTDLTLPQTISRVEAGQSILFIALPPSLAMVSSAQ